MNKGKAYSAELWREAIAQRRPWLKSTGPRTAAGRRKMAENATRSGVGGQAMVWAMRYVAAVTRALGA